MMFWNNFVSNSEEISCHSALDGVRYFLLWNDYAFSLLLWQAKEGRLHPAKRGELR